MGDYSALPTLTQVTKAIFGNKRAHFWKLSTDGTSTWPAAGLTLTPANLGLVAIDQLFIDPGISGIMFTYDYTNQVLHAYTAPTTSGPTHVMVKATGSTPVAAVVNILALGYGVN
jgi:hypothetical protein